MTFADDWNQLRSEIGKAIVGHDEVVDGVLTCLFAGGHTLAGGCARPWQDACSSESCSRKPLHLHFSRIQFTPDLMPADVTGTTIVVEGDGGREFKFRKGPIFAQIVLADEINRATPKTQSSLLEAMQEKSVTVGGVTHILGEALLRHGDAESEWSRKGTYPLPEAQLDRFFFKLVVGLQQPRGNEQDSSTAPPATCRHLRSNGSWTRPTIVEHQKTVRAASMCPHWFRTMPSVVCWPPIPVAILRRRRSSDTSEWALRPARARHWCWPPRFMPLREGRVGRSNPMTSPDVILPAMRHRCILNFEAEAEGVTTDQVLQNIVDTVPAEAMIPQG